MHFTRILESQSRVDQLRWREKQTLRNGTSEVLICLKAHEFSQAELVRQTLVHTVNLTLPVNVTPSLYNLIEPQFYQSKMGVVQPTS